METGDMKILGNFRRMIDLIKADALYNPSNALLVIGKLEQKLAASIISVDDIGVKIAPSKFVINDRQTAYAETVLLVRGSRNLLKASGASQKTLADADTFSRKAATVESLRAKTDSNSATRFSLLLSSSS